MEYKSIVEFEGKVLLEHFREGKKILERKVPNIVTNAGLALISGVLISDVAVNDCDEIAIGTGAIGGTADSGTTTTTVDAERTEADGYWVGATITYTTGDNVGESQSITAFDATTDTITHGAFSNAVTAGDQYKLSARPASTALESEITSGGGSRQTGADVTGTRQTTNVTNDTAQLVTTFTFTAAFAVDEAGVFNDPAAGDMLCATAFGAANVVSGDTLQITWQVVSSKG